MCGRRASNQVLPPPLKNRTQTDRPELLHSDPTRSAEAQPANELPARARATGRTCATRVCQARQPARGAHKRARARVKALEKRDLVPVHDTLQARARDVGERRGLCARRLQQQRREGRLVVAASHGGAELGGGDGGALGVGVEWLEGVLAARHCGAPLALGLDRRRRRLLCTHHRLYDHRGHRMERVGSSALRQDPDSSLHRPCPSDTPSKTTDSSSE